MSKILQLRGLCVSFLVLLLSLPAVSRAQSRQRNTIYVLDCTGSMSGYNGSPDIWAPTKKFLRSELEKEARENPGATVTVLPFQEKVLHPIRVNLNNIAWPNLERVLDGYTKNVTATNICDSWLEAERYIDQSCDNYIVLMTDGHDNIGGTANEANRTERLERILHDFCGKYQNTKGFYVQLTQAASLPAGILEAIDLHTIFAEYTDNDNLEDIIAGNDALNRAIMRGLKGFGMKEYITRQNIGRWLFLPDNTSVARVIPDLDARALPFCPYYDAADRPRGKYIFVNGITQDETASISRYFTQAPMPVSTSSPYSISILDVVRYDLEHNHAV